MKKIFTLLAAIFTATSLSAQIDLTQGVNDSYDGSVVVEVNGNVSTPVDAHVNIEKNQDNSINFVLTNFVLDGMPIGNIRIDNIPLTLNEDKGLIEFSKNEEIMITDGDPSVSPFWMGPGLGIVPVNITHGEVLYDYIDIDIDINMALLGQIVHVDFSAGSLDSVEKIHVANTKNDGITYNLAGQQVNAHAKGIIIKNGKKFIK